MAETVSENLKSVPVLLEIGKLIPENNYDLFFLNCLLYTYLDCFQL